jgi:APA family basic amino acid/polyamine antiporter
MNERPGLARSLSLTTATAIVIGSVIGSGIFKKAAGMTDVLPSPVLVLAIWVAAGLVTFLGGLSAAELAAAFPESGGLYAHLRRVMGRFTGFLYGWSVLSVIQTGSIASIAYIFAQYLGYFGGWGPGPAALNDVGYVLLGVIDVDPLRDLWTKLVAVACIGVVTATNVAGVRFGAAVQDVFMYLKVAVMVGIVLVAVAGTGSFDHVTGPSLVPEGAGFASLVGAVTLAMSGAFWAYDGWINVTYVASEVRRPERDLPRAMALGLAVVTACYVAVNLAYYYLLPMDAVRSSTLVAADAMSRVLPFGAALVSAAVVVSTYGALNGTTMSSARVHYALARDGLFFQAVGRVHATRRTPHVSLTLQGIWSAALVFSGTFDQITDMLIFVSWAFYGLLALAVIVARVRFPDVPRPYRVPGYPWVPAAFVLFSAAYVVLSVMENTRNALFGTLLVAAGLPVWIVFAYRRPRHRDC